MTPHAAPPRSALATAVLTLSLGLSSMNCTTSRRTPDDTLVVVLDGKLRSVDPRFISTNNDVKFSRLVAPGLTTIDQPTLEPVEDLAESVEQLSETLWQVRLKPGLQFSTGTPVTAHDVAYSYNSAMDPATKATVGGGYRERFKTIEVVDERTVRFHLNQPESSFLSDIEFGILSAEAGKRGEVVGAGAYKVVSFEAEERLRLTVNPLYHGSRPRIPNVDVRVVRDANALAIMLVGGSADATLNGLRLDLVDSIAQRARVEADSAPGVILTYLLFNNEDEALDDPRVRRAIAHALDRERIIEAKMGGLATLATTLMPTGHWAHEPDIDTYAYDPAKSKQLLDEAGFPDPDGPGGAPRLSLSYKTNNNQFRLALAHVMAAQLGEVGIDVTVRGFESGTFMTDVKKGNYQLAILQTPPLTDPNYFYTYFHSARIPDPKTLFGHNRWRYRNARVDELVARGRRVADREQRVILYSEVQKLLGRDLPMLPLWHAHNVLIRNVEVQGFEILPNASFRGLISAQKAVP